MFTLFLEINFDIDLSSRHYSTSVKREIICLFSLSYSRRKEEILKHKVGKVASIGAASYTRYKSF